jgi:hypothetical protein
MVTASAGLSVSSPSPNADRGHRKKKATPGRKTRTAETGD